MRIAIDISQIIYKTGVSFYTKNLVTNLLKIDHENEYILFGGSLRQISNLKSQISKFEGNYISKIFPIPPTLADFLWNQLHVLPIERLIGKIDILHSSNWAQPPTRAFTVTTVHDLSFLKYPRLTDQKVLRTQMRNLLRIKDEVQRIIVPSQATKEDLITFGIKNERIVVIPEAAGEKFLPHQESEIEEVKKKHKIRGKYLITIGVGGRKNTERLIKAFELAKAGEELKLVLVGQPLGRIKEDRGLIYTGGIISDNELAVLISGAGVLVYPSLYEGFGLPVLQGFACGVPVVTSNVSSLPEVANGAAILVDPFKVNEIAEGIKTALRGRKGWIEKGLRRAKDFSWEKTAQETLKVYQEAKNNNKQSLKPII
jgi:glycosyltransferase involved in cell wall biosynthesis